MKPAQMVKQWCNMVMLLLLNFRRAIKTQRFLTPLAPLRKFQWSVFAIANIFSSGKVSKLARSAGDFMVMWASVKHVSSHCIHDHLEMTAGMMGYWLVQQ